LSRPAVLLLAACLAGTAGAQEDGWIPFRVEGRVVFVKATLNGGKPLPFIVDTGATETVITPPTARQAGLKVFDAGSRHGKAGVRSLAIGNAVLRDFTAFIFDPPQAIPLRLNQGVDYRGLVGYPFLSRFVTTFDYPNTRLQFLSLRDAGRVPWEDGHRVPFRLKDSLVHAQGTINGKGPVTFLVDTGSAEVLIHPRTAVELGLKATRPQTEGGARFTRLSSISLGGAERKNVLAIVHTPPTERVYRASYHAILGYPFLSHFAVTFHYRDRVLLLVPGSPSPKARLRRAPATSAR
jgi:predicted aspartyl protease